MMVIKTDSEAPTALLGKLRERPNIVRVKSMVLPGKM